MNIDLIAYIPYVILLVQPFEDIEYSVKLLTPIIDHVLYMLHKYNITLYLNRFRGKPAISSLNGLSPLTTIHPSIMQHTRVRSSYEY